MSWSGNYAFVMVANRTEFLNTLNGGSSRLFTTALATKEQLETSRSILIETISEKWPDTTWYTLKRTTLVTISRRYEWKKKITWVGRIPTDTGLVTVWRNGNNQGNYNYAIHNPSGFYFRKDNQQVMDFLEMLFCENKDLPMFMARELCDANKIVLEKLLKGELHGQNYRPSRGGYSSGNLSPEKQ
jgi:hypothetical protein